VANPATEAYVPMGKQAPAFYTISDNERPAPSTAPMSESNAPKDGPDKQVRESRHTFVPKVNSNDTTATPTPMPAAVGETAVVVTTLSDNQILGIAQTMQNANLAEASIAAERAQAPRVKEFAAKLSSDNKHLKERTQELAKSAKLTPAESPVSADLRVKASQELTSVELARPDEFDRAFIDAQVQENEEMLQLINGRLIPNASKPELKDELTRSKAVIERQTEQAKDIQRNLTTGPQ